MKHLVIFPESEVEHFLKGSQGYTFRFFSKRPDFLPNISPGDTIFFRKKRGEVLGQFLIGKLIVMERVGAEDWESVKNYLHSLINEDTFKTKATENRLLLIIQIEKLEQFITSPIDMPRNSRKEWLVFREAI